jgi:hypothetical protein
MIPGAFCRGTIAIPRRGRGRGGLLCLPPPGEGAPSPRAAAAGQRFRLPSSAVSDPGEAFTGGPGRTRRLRSLEPPPHWHESSNGAALRVPLIPQIDCGRRESETLSRHTQTLHAPPQLAWVRRITPSIPPAPQPPATAHSPPATPQSCPGAKEGVQRPGNVLECAAVAEADPAHPPAGGWEVAAVPLELLRRRA